jgi:hypothetical protein
MTGSHRWKNREIKSGVETGALGEQANYCRSLVSSLLPEVAS